MVTSERNFDIDGKRLCTVAKSEQQSDTVNLHLVEDLIREEANTIYNVITSLKTEMLHSNKLMIDAL